MADLKRCDSFFCCINLSEKICVVDECCVSRSTTVYFHEFIF
uniref:Uncharacterized protein n=1 Tax=Oryza barthii TaxID=65489 RepID=A0A0D3GIY0_9ORYZ